MERLELHFLASFPQRLSWSSLSFLFILAECRLHTAEHASTTYRLSHGTLFWFHQLPDTDMGKWLRANWDEHQGTACMRAGTVSLWGVASERAVSHSWARSEMAHPTTAEAGVRICAKRAARCQSPHLRQSSRGEICHRRP